MSINVRILKAHHGDSILITINSESAIRRILIDGGPAATFSSRGRPGELQKVLDKLKDSGDTIDLVILTHIDDDHIGGLIKAFENHRYLPKIASNVIFNSRISIYKYFNQEIDYSESILGNFTNSTQTSIHQGDTLENFLDGLNIWDKRVFKQSDKYYLGDAVLHFLSPNIKGLEKLKNKLDKQPPRTFTSGKSNDWECQYNDLLAEDHFQEDSSPYNGSSLAFILSVGNLNLVFLGDAHPSVVIEGLKSFGYDDTNPLNANMVKISHHGSKYNTNQELLNILNTNKYIISTDGSQHELPNKITLARIHSHTDNSTIYFNYEEMIHKIYSPEEIDELDMRIQYLDEGLTFE